MYHTPPRIAAAIENPGPPPTPPTAPRRLPRKNQWGSSVTRQSLKKYHGLNVAKYNAALEVYQDSCHTWESDYKKYIKSLDLGLLDGTEEEDVAITEVNGDEDPIAAAKPLVVFTHGRNSTLENQHLTAFCQGFAREAPILLFEDLRNELQRIAVFRTLVSTYPSIRAFSGRSAGARNAAKASIHADVKRLIFFTYPLVRDLNYRYADLLALGPDIEVLFVVGDSDPLAVETHLHEVRGRMQAKSWWIKVVKGDHTFGRWTDEQMETTLGIAGQMAAIWAKTEELDPQLTELILLWSDKQEKVDWTGWQPPPPESPRAATHFTVTLAGGKLPAGGGSFHFTLPGTAPK